MFTAIISTLVGVAASLGLSSLVGYLNAKKTVNTDAQSGVITKAVNTILNKARSKGTQVLNDITNKLNAIPNLSNVSMSAKQAVIAKLKQLNEAKTDVERTINEAETSAEAAAQQAANIENLSNETRSSSIGKALREQAISDAEKASEYYSNLANKYENSILKE